jgi:thiamine pyrophosphokinase
MSKFFFVTYCDDEDIHLLKRLYTEGDVIVGVDQGFDVLMRNEIVPEYVIGDFDSTLLCEDEFPDRCKVIKLNTEKDESDLEYAINYFQDSGASYTNFVIINNLQGRTDHTMSAIHLVETYPNISIMSGSQEIELVENDFTKELPIDTCVSLIPLTDKVSGVSTQGLYYGLQNEILYRKKSRGLSNKNTEKVIKINISDGKLLVISNTRQDGVQPST